MYQHSQSLHQQTVMFWIGEIRYVAATNTVIGLLSLTKIVDSMNKFVWETNINSRSLEYFLCWFRCCPRTQHRITFSSHIILRSYFQLIPCYFHIQSPFYFILLLLIFFPVERHTLSPHGNRHRVSDTSKLLICIQSKCNASDIGHDWNCRPSD